MNPYYLPRNYYKARSKVKSRSKHKWDWMAAALLFISVLVLYCVLFPESAGEWGKNIAKVMGWLSGLGRFIIPLYTGYLAWRLIFNKNTRFPLLHFLSLFVLLESFLVFSTLLGQAVWKENLGGVMGLMGGQLFGRLFGVVGSWLLSFGLMMVSIILLLRLSPGDIFHKSLDLIKTDLETWKKKKEPKVQKEKKPAVVAPAPLLAAPEKPPKPLKIMSPVSDAEGPSKKPFAPLLQKDAPKEAPLKNGQIKEKAKEPAAQPARPPYESPSLEIFESADGRIPVSKEELTSRAKLLEQTLANFNIAANVVEIHPGPVITRYDLEPAPGVKISTIASRADDLALALKSTGIRILTPVPGKGAVGIEIPNLNPEKVGLQELLSRPEFYNHKSPLAFVLGKTVSGEPCIVDLAAMPHLLVAGSTGSGKSVAVHALICSILYRMPPDRVKFVLIDPKRLELPGYLEIPHLYDPGHPPAQAEVITHSKQAAKVLSRLVKVMEFRYDLFAKANVRNIESYNQKRQAQGLPPEHYIVVIIDELADLMLTSPKEVEDSIQRLAQMARAVGVHLVLATQRPSVDVITGVIKANLPARIALRVASAIDSRVIVDCVGAELLLGKGDMLYLPPAQPEPMRVQGAFVSEKEVENLVKHTKKFGLPQYDDLFGSGSVLEFAVEDKKEMMDLIEALKLVLERRRVSQDLLKAHFGSSARATNILSLLEVKQFIIKPEGSNRWDINFDRIEEFIQTVNNIPEKELMS